jgi:hypothetical protein
VKSFGGEFVEGFDRAHRFTFNSHQYGMGAGDAAIDLDAAQQWAIRNACGTKKYSVTFREIS